MPKGCVKMIEGFCSIFLWSSILTRNALRKWHGMWPTSTKGWWFWTEKLHSMESLGMSTGIYLCPNGFVQIGNLVF